MNILDFKLMDRPVRWVRNKATQNSPHLRSVVQRRPEVMFKITGFSKSYSHVGKTLNYISRDGKLELEINDGCLVTGRKEISELVRDWTGETNKKPRANQRTATSMIFSMPPGTSPKGVKNAVRELAAKEFGENHSYAFALHTDREHPHVHLLVHQRGWDGKSLRIDRDRLQQLREKFAESLKEQGIEAAASPRQSRGIVRKSERTGYYRVKERLHAKGERTEVEKAQIQEVYQEVTGQKAKRTVWENRLSESQKEVRKAWLDHAKATASTDKTYSDQIVAFVRAMPVQKTRREELGAALVAAMQRQHMQDRNHNYEQNKPDKRNI